jgi:POT family proton-dependent oligopeptide transporter
MGSLLMVYLENKVDRHLLGWEIPSAMITAMNPLVIIGFGPMLSGMLQKRQIGLFKRLGIAFLFLGTAFSILYLGQAFAHRALHVMVSFSCIALGELFLAPAVYAYCSEIAPENQKGLTMGIVTLAFSIASLLSGGISQMATLDINGLFLFAASLSFVVFAGLFFYPQSSLKQGFSE